MNIGGNMGRKKTPMEWAYEHVENLKKVKEKLIQTKASDYISEYLQNIDKGCQDLSKAGESGITEAYHVLKQFCNVD